MAKKVAGYIKLIIPGGSANPSPPVGPALGQRGLNIMEFCKAFNAQTQEQKGIPLPVVITAFQDRTFTFEVKTPPNTHFVKEAAKITSGSKTPGRGANVGSVKASQLREIAKIKIKNTNSHTEEAVVQQLRGSARSMGLTVVED